MRTEHRDGDDRVPGQTRRSLRTLVIEQRVGVWRFAVAHNTDVVPPAYLSGNRRPGLMPVSPATDRFRTQGRTARDSALIVNSAASINGRAWTCRAGHTAPDLLFVAAARNTRSHAERTGL